MNGIGNGNSNACYSEPQGCAGSEKRPFIPAGEALGRMADLADECISISEVLAHVLFAVDQDKPVLPAGSCFADQLESTAGKVAAIKANLLVLADRFGIQL